MKKLLGACAAAALMGAAGSAHAIVLYANNFDGAVTVDAGVTPTLTGFTLQNAATGAWNANGWSGKYADNHTGGGGSPSSLLSLSFSNLAPHTTVSASFILGFLESWDSYNGGCCSPDQLDVKIDGVLKAMMTSNNALGTVEDYDGGTELFDGVQANGNGFYSDTLVNMGTAPFLTFAHTGSTLTITLQALGDGWQGGTDEGFGIDNLSITYDGVHQQTPGVPEPATWAFMIMGFGAAGAMLRRRRSFAAA